MLIGQQSTYCKSCSWGLVPPPVFPLCLSSPILSVFQLFSVSLPKEISYHCELRWLSAFILSDHKPPCSFLTLSPTYHPKEPFWPVVKRIKIICSVLGAQTHLSTPYEVKRARGASAQDRSHGVCVWHRPIRDQKRMMSPFPATYSSLSAMHCTGDKRPLACTAACQS